MSNDNDFRDDTVMRPRPGGRNVSLTPSESSPSSPPSASIPIGDNEGKTVVRRAASTRVSGAGMPIINGVAENSLVKHATTLLSLAAKLQQTTSLDDVGGLRQQCIDRIHDFEEKLRSENNPIDDIYAARYCMCSLLDEIVLNTLWGGPSIWSNSSLLATFHKDTGGGDHFFKLLNTRLETPEQSINLLELMYLCLSLGFQGKYRIAVNGLRAHDELRTELHHVITRIRGEYERQLSIRWLPQELSFKRITKVFPLWAVFAFSGALLLAVFLGFSYSVNKLSNPTYSRLVNLIPDSFYEQTVEISEPKKIEIIRLRDFLIEEIDQGLLEVHEAAGQARVVLFSSALFASGNASINSEFRPLLEKIASSIEKVKGKVNVIGHTDDRPIFSVKFPSNWHLSLARATSVVEILGEEGRLDGQLIPDGRGDTQPIATNETAEGRANNRRVEIIVTYSALSK